MSKYLLVAAVMGLAACGDKAADTPPADTTTVAPVAPVAPPDTMPRDTTDTTKTARDTTKTN